MISKQEGGTDRGRLQLPGEQGDWAARNLIPLPPSSSSSPALYGSSVPAESSFSRGPRLWSSRGTGVDLAGGGASTKYGIIIHTRATPPRADWLTRRAASLFVEKAAPNKGFRVLLCKK